MSAICTALLCYAKNKEMLLEYDLGIHMYFVPLQQDLEFV